VSSENILVLAGILAEALFLGILVWRRSYKSFPIFFSYIAWGLAGDAAILILRTLLHNQNPDIWALETLIDSIFQYAVLIELAWSILRPIRGSLPKGFLPGLSILIAAAAALAWPLCALKDSTGYALGWLFALHVQRSFAVLRILFFMALAGCSQFLRIGWRDRELQVATGLGFYSLVSLAGTMVHSHQVFGLQYYYVELVIAGSYLVSLVYWVASFAHQETARREMTPAMEEFLLGMAKVMRRQRRELSGPTISS
jgi:hypothetical protein